MQPIECGYLYFSVQLTQRTVVKVKPNRIYQLNYFEVSIENVKDSNRVVIRVDGSESSAPESGDHDNKFHLIITNYIET